MAIRNNQRQTKLDEAGSGEAIRAHGNAYLIDAKKPGFLAGLVLVGYYLNCGYDLFALS